MQFTSLLATSLLALAVSAQKPVTSIPSGSNIHMIQVSDSNADLKFIPNSITANVGDFVTFQFHPHNHSVIQSNFANPCVPIQDINATDIGIFSGFFPVANNATVFPTYSVEITSPAPFWFYCGQGKHCQSGMVGVVNPPAAHNVNDFAALAAMAPANLIPGEAFTAPPSTSTSAAVVSSSAAVSTSATMAMSMGMGGMYTTTVTSYVTVASCSTVPFVPPTSASLLPATTSTAPIITGGADRSHVGIVGGVLGAVALVAALF